MAMVGWGVKPEREGGLARRPPDWIMVLVVQLLQGLYDMMMVGWSIQSEGKNGATVI